MADHEAPATGWAKLRANLAYRAKALIAGIGALVGSELVVVITDASFQGQVQGLVPPAYAFLVPVVFGVVVGAITHQVSNGPKPPVSEQTDAS